MLYSHYIFEFIFYFHCFIMTKVKSKRRIFKLFVYCLFVYQRFILFINMTITSYAKRPSLNSQDDSIQAKLFT